MLAPRRRSVAIAAVVAAAASVAASAANAQGVRISGVTSLQYIELRPLVTDSAPIASIPGTGEWRSSPGGVPALCSDVTGFCRYERSGTRVGAMPVLQDLTVAGWGGVEGLSFRADLRGRTQAGGSAFTWPRADDHFDVLDAYAELERGSWRSRLGRQWVTGGLGTYNFDGADATWRREAWSVEGWAGRALLGGLNDTYTSGELAAVENLPPDDGGLMFGARGRYRPDALTAASLLYQRILVADRSGLYSERVAFDASTRRYGAQADLTLTYDLAYGDWNEARLRIGTGSYRSSGASFEVRHSRPYFDLWTIWGAFAPVGFDEARATAFWKAPGAPVTVSVRGAYRKYADTEAGFDLRTNGWRAGGDATWTPSAGMVVTGSYDVDIGSGAANSDGRLGARWLPGNDYSLGADLSVTQNIYEFRVGTGRIYGVALSGAMPLGPSLRLAADAGLYQHALSNGAAGPDWTQRRVSARLEWTLGRDPGLGGGR
ncbi:MAG: hypothetical protein U9Q74_18105 [Gemmatimonadota bacterium]|nr:hypothetical protein [Gemmatimonadota bacterium]